MGRNTAPQAAGGRLQSYDWTIKVDPDPVLILWRILKPAYLPCSSFQFGKLAHCRTYPAWRCLRSGYFTPEEKQDNSQDGKGAVAVASTGMGALRSRVAGVQLVSEASVL